MDFNSITIMGRIARKPELRKQNDGSQYATLSVAYGESYLVNGEWKKNSYFFDVVVYGRSVPQVAAMEQGQDVVVSGRLVYYDYQKQDGSKARQYNINASVIKGGIPSAPKNNQNTGYGGYGQ